MRGFLLDTNVVSEAVTSIPNQRVLDWIDSVPESDLFLSVMTLGELRQGTAKLV